MGRGCGDVYALHIAHSRQRPLKELIPRAKPEIPFLNPSEPPEIFGFESVAGHWRIFEKTQHSLARHWPEPALRAGPLFALKAPPAAEAMFHRALTPGAICERNV
jgi:hypothetical protein